MRRTSAPTLKNSRFRGGAGPGTAFKNSPGRHPPKLTRNSSIARRPRTCHWPGYPFQVDVDEAEDIVILRQVQMFVWPLDYDEEFDDEEPGDDEGRTA